MFWYWHHADILHIVYDAISSKYVAFHCLLLDLFFHICLMFHLISWFIHISANLEEMVSFLINKVLGIMMPISKLCTSIHISSWLLCTCIHNRPCYCHQFLKMYFPLWLLLSYIYFHRTLPLIALHNSLGMHVCVRSPLLLVLATSQYFLLPKICWILFLRLCNSPRFC